MKSRIALALSVLALLCPFLCAGIMCLFEKELTEALASGLLIGCALGSASGIAALILNQNRNKCIKVLSVMPMCPLILFAVLAIPYFLFR